jgi:Ni/Fe-hydrogenase subunit HybB-like protein
MGASGAALTDRLLGLAGTGRVRWGILFLLAGAGTALFLAAIAWTIAFGIGTWGNNIPVAWAFGIINFVWWIGIGHAGTFISAFLLLFHQPWRSSINRIAEAMTVFALVNAALFPILHLGRPWFFYWLIPYPSRMQVWPQFKSALPWDVAAITTYLIVSVLFWYLGLMPDLAAARDRSRGLIRRRIYGLLAAGWRGSGRDWREHRTAYLLMAGLAAPLVISVHSIVSLDFAIAQLPGWHSTIFPPYFVVGAIYSGLAMVLLLLLPLRRLFGLADLVTARHLDNLAKLLLFMAWLLAYAYLVETWAAWYGGDLYERYAYLVQRPLGSYAWLFWAMLAANVLVPQVLWVPRWRASGPVLAGVALLVLAGMWVERFMIVVASLARDFLPSSWESYAPSPVDWGLLLGSVGLFLLLFLMFLRWVPVVPISEVRHLQQESAEG